MNMQFLATLSRDVFTRRFLQEHFYLLHQQLRVLRCSSMRQASPRSRTVKPWSSLVEGYEGCTGSSGKLLCL